MATVQSAKARSKLSELLRRVERGEQFLITRRGKQVARLLPVAKARKTKVSVAMEGLRELRKGTSSDGRGWQELRDAGRKY